jgi:hypothetical protein
MAIEATSETGAIVASPVYTNEAVHEALSRARLIDSAPDAFLTAPDGISAASEL